MLGTVRMSGPDGISLRVIHGNSVKEDEFPYVVVLIAKNVWSLSRICTGSMLTADWGLSAGHCKPIITTEYTSIYAWYGNFTQWPFHSNKCIPVVEWKVHPAYRLLNTDDHPDLLVDNDISLFRIEASLKLTRYARLSAVDRGSLLGLPVIYIGGGSTKGKNYYEPMERPLKKGEGAIISCSVDIRMKSRHVVCINPKCDLKIQYPWYGDSGGPLIHGEQIIGVCSYVVDVGDVHQSVFVSTSPFIDWISFVIHSKT
ncbi:granzyme D-like [Spodoptera litura]|uniref:Granzyme D-like n=1 Tax=Spodoptera litura TaxID=69820 RepID=A0A9J7IYE9_SPOLT|nr:granzyme D-like [Spodoptera litura]